MATGSSNVSVTAINCTSTVSMASSEVSASETSATVSITTASPSSSTANTIDLSKSANESTAAVNMELNVSAGAHAMGGTQAAHNVNNNNNNNNININSSNTSTNHSSNSNNNNNNQPAHFYGNGSVRIAVPKMEESDSETELGQIECAAAAGTAVSMRSGAGNSKNTPRPMSWEGELSENEDPMETDSSNGLAKATAADNSIVISYATNGNAAAAIGQQTQTTASSADNKSAMSELYASGDIKPEYVDYAATGASAEGGSHSIAFAPTKRYPLDMSNVKFEATLQAAANQYGLPHHQHQHQHQQQQSDINSPLLIRSKANNLLPANPSPDSAIHSVYTHSSPSQSPLTSRHTPYTPTLSRNNSDASYSSCYSYSSEFSPTHSPIQGRHSMYGNGTFNGSPLHHSVLFKPMIDNNDNAKAMQATAVNEDTALEAEIMPSAGISRQQLINSPCPICGDKISGFHYGIFSCESCKGFFKRTVQNRKNYVCLRGGPCPITIATRKKCPACRFEKCLQRGMKLEAIREDRTRGGRSTYQCSYTLPMLSPSLADGTLLITNNRTKPFNVADNVANANGPVTPPAIPVLLQEIMDVEHLWKFSEAEINKLNQNQISGSDGDRRDGAGTSTANLASNPLLASLANGDSSNPDLIANLCSIADHRLYKIVKWCKSLPLFKNISIDDQICLLINSWCELLLFSCCFRSISTPGEIRISQGKSINLEQAKSSGLQACIERMLNLTDHLRRLRVDRYEYVAMKVIVLLQSDTSDLREPEKVRSCQEKALHALQTYTLAHYSDAASKFGELLIRIPELQRTCQVGKEMLTIKSKDGAEFNLLLELLRGEH